MHLHFLEEHTIENLLDHIASVDHAFRQGPRMLAYGSANFRKTPILVLLDCFEEGAHVVEALGPEVRN